MARQLTEMLDPQRSAGMAGVRDVATGIARRILESEGLAGRAIENSQALEDLTYMVKQNLLANAAFESQSGRSPGFQDGGVREGLILD
jgi:hypothetical protein